MKTYWKTNKGDEWHYEGKHIRAYADLYSDSSILDIRHVADTTGTITGDSLLGFLVETAGYFSVLQMHVRLDSSEINETLGSLRAAGKVTFEVVPIENSRDGVGQSFARFTDLLSTVSR